MGYSFDEKIGSITKTSIGWATHTWNPIWGCRRGCPYCYARRIALRFGEIVAKENGQNPENVKSFNLVWLEKNYEKEFPKRPTRIFINSMSDPEWWPVNWTRKILEKTERHQKHLFILLTKSTSETIIPYIIRTAIRDGRNISNLVFGITATDQYEYRRASDLLRSIKEKYDAQFKTMISIEPLRGWDISMTNFYDPSPYNPEWIVVGPETGTTKMVDASGEEISPENIREWVNMIRDMTFKNLIPLWEKDPCRIYTKRENIQEPLEHAPAEEGEEE